MAGWGSGGWGKNPWGGGGAPAPALPSVVQFVKSKDLRRVWIQFNGAVDPFALNPLPYTFIGLSVPCYNPTVKSARFLNGKGIVLNSLVELYLENDLSPGVQYQLSISAFTGVPDTQATFTAFAPNWPPLRSFSLWDVIPQINKAEDESEHLQRFVLCLQDQLDTTLSASDNWVTILDYDHAPEAYLDAMLADLGNPFAFESLTEFDKRALVGALVKMYQLKGTDRGIEAAIRFFLGFDSQVTAFRFSGSLLGSQAVPIDLLDQSFVLGGGGPFDFTVTVATTDPPGRALTTLERSRIRKLIDVVKSIGSRFKDPIFYGLPAPSRVQISGGSSSVTVSWNQTTTVPDFWRVYYRINSPAVTPFNSARYQQVAGTTTSITLSIPVGSDPAGSVYYFTIVPYYGGTEGLHSDVEVRSGLAAPGSVLATAGVRSVKVTWAANAAATSYKIYKTLPSTASSSTPIVADYVFQVDGDTTTFLDEHLLPGQVVHYTVVSLVGDSEGFYSLSTSGTAT